MTLTKGNRCAHETWRKKNEFFHGLPEFFSSEGSGKEKHGAFGLIFCERDFLAAK
jgi:hypothetical protein